MNSEIFVYWLKGFFEISNNPDQQISAQQVQIIKDHLDLVFKKETPVYTAIDPNVKYKEDTGGIRLTDIKLPTYGSEFQLMGDRIQDGWPVNLAYNTEIIQNTPVEITKTYDYIQWGQPDCSC